MTNWLLVYEQKRGFVMVLQNQMVLQNRKTLQNQMALQQNNLSLFQQDKTREWDKTRIPLDCDSGDCFISCLSELCSGRFFGSTVVLCVIRLFDVYYYPTKVAQRFLSYMRLLPKQNKKNYVPMFCNGNVCMCIYDNT